MLKQNINIQTKFVYFSIVTFSVGQEVYNWQNKKNKNKRHKTHHVVPYLLTFNGATETQEQIRRKVLKNRNNKDNGHDGYIMLLLLTKPYINLF